MNMKNIPGVKRKDLFAVPFNVLKIKKNLNVRKSTHYGDIELLADMILQNGVNPIEVIKKGDDIIIKDGHRRSGGIQFNIDRGMMEPDVLVNCFLEPKGTSEEQRIIDMMMCAESLPLEILDEAEAYARLIRLNLTPSEIGKRVGKTSRHVSDRLSLLEAPQATRDALEKGIISKTSAITISKVDEKTQNDIIKFVAKSSNKKTTLNAIQKQVTGKSQHISGKYVDDLIKLIDGELSKYDHTVTPGYQQATEESKITGALRDIKSGVLLCRGDISFIEVLAKLPK